MQLKVRLFQEFFPEYPKAPSSLYHSRLFSEAIEASQWPLKSEAPVEVAEEFLKLI